MTTHTILSDTDERLPGSAGDMPIVTDARSRIILDNATADEMRECIISHLENEARNLAWCEAQMQRAITHYYRNEAAGSWPTATIRQRDEAYVRWASAQSMVNYLQECQA